MMKITKLEGWKKKTHQKDVTLNNSEDSTMSKIKKLIMKQHLHQIWC